MYSSYETSSSQSASAQKQSILQRLRDWVRREIMDDDPWDEGGFFMDEEVDSISYRDLMDTLLLTLEHPEPEENCL